MWIGEDCGSEIGGREWGMEEVGMQAEDLG